VLDEIEAHDLCNRAAELGERIVDALRAGLAGDNRIQDVRGLGLMIAVELDQDVSHLVALGLEQGVLINVTQGNIVRLLPPLTLTDAEADELASKVVTLIQP
jgi:acetylornithine/N-succinyldiaminopimelate aminotransferase